MNLLYCIPSLCNSGGMERILTEKANWLNRKGFSVDIVTTEQENKTPFFQLDKGIRLININIGFDHHFSSNIIKKAILHKLKLRAYKRSLQELIDKGNYDIVISLCGKEIDFLTELNGDFNRVAELHFSQNFKSQFIESRHKNWFYKVLGKFLTKKFIDKTRRLDALVVLTKEDKDKWMVTNDNVRQIYNFAPSLSPAHGVSAKKGNKRCIAIGKLDEQKGFDLLIDVWKEVANECPDWILEIFGDGKWMEMLQNKINDYGLSQQIHLKGRTEDAISELRRSEIFVLSSRYEGFPMVLLEAAKVGLPIVSFDCKTGPNEIIIDGVNGYLIEVGNITQMANRIITLIKHPELRVEFGEKSKIQMNRFDKEVIMKEWVSLFNYINETSSDKRYCQ